MQRRQFLHTTGLAAAAVALPAGIACATAPRAAVSQFQLLRAESAEPGARFVPFDLASCADCGTEAVRIHLDGFHPAEDGAVLQEFWLSALFDVPGAEPAPFLAWQHVAGTAPRRSQRLSFVAGRASVSGFELDYRLAEEAACTRENCALTSFTTPLIAPGHYSLTGPRRKRRKKRIDARGLCHSGDPSAPLRSVEARDFDYLAFRVEALG
jgi:hypothetical protein